MSNKIIVPFDDQEGGTYELNIDLDRLSKGEVLNAIVGIGRTIDLNNSRLDNNSCLVYEQ